MNCLGQKHGHNFIGKTCLDCGIDQNELSYGKKVEVNYLEGYIEKIKAKKVETKARNYMEELAWKYLEKLAWRNETFEKDWKFFWIACNTYWKKHLPFEFENLLKWAAEKEVYPNAISNKLRRG